MAFTDTGNKKCPKRHIRILQRPDLGQKAVTKEKKREFYFLFAKRMTLQKRVLQKVKDN